MSTNTKSQLLKEIGRRFIEEVLLYLGVAALASLLVISLNWAYGGLTFGEAPVLGFFKVWSAATVGLMTLTFAFRVLLFCLEVVLFLIFAIGYIGCKWWRERRKGSGTGGPPSLRDRHPGEPPHR